MTYFRHLMFPATAAMLLACAPSAAPRAGDSASATTTAAAANAALDSLNARLARAYQTRDPALYTTLYADSGVFEWPGATVRGHAALGEMARGIWAAERDVELAVDVASRQVAGERAAEFGAFRQTWTDTANVRRTEFGRYAASFVRQAEGGWRIERWLGFEDSVRTVAPRP